MRTDFFPDDWGATQRQFGYCQAIKTGGTVYISGTAAVDGHFAPAHPGDFDAQTRLVYERLGATLAHFSLGFSDVVREVMYVTSMENLVAAMPLRKSFYGDGPFPTATAVEVRQLLFPELMIEVELVAVCRS